MRALLDGSHIHHERATRWLASEIEAGWASCPITQNGCVRILSQPAYPKEALIYSILPSLRAP